MPHDLKEIWKFAPVVAVLVIILWAGHKGFWYWGRGTRAVIRNLERERDEWKELSRMLLKKYVEIELPATVSPRTITETLKRNGGEDG